MSRDEFISAARENPPRKAPYTFVSAGSKVLESPSGIPDISRPVAEAISGKLTVTWTAETEILVGGGEAETADAGNNSPLRIGDQYMLPGSTIKGLIRTTMESACFARLSFIDDYSAYTRNFTSDPTWKAEVSLTPDHQLKGGWLFRIPGTDSAGRSTAQWKLVPADSTEPFDFDDLLPLLGVSANDWHDMSMHDRLTTMATQNKDGHRPASDFIPGMGGTARLVVSGPTPAAGRNKHREYLFLWPDGITADDRRIVALDAGTARRFIAAQHRDGNNHPGNPEANLDALITTGCISGFLADNNPGLDEQLRNPALYGLPVFWRNPQGAPQNKPGRTPILSLTALYRVTYRNTVHDLLKAHNSQLPDDKLDLVQALLGWAPPETPATRIGDRKGVEKSLRSRVMFGFAASDNAQPESTYRTWSATRPRPSFWPFYLRPKEGKNRSPMDYNNPDATVAGRKRYPARNDIQALPHDAENTEMISDLTFLKRGAEFTGDIRLRNVSLIELGALIWALTFGDLAGDKGYRHMIGRARPFGYGQVRVNIAASDLRAARADIEAGELMTRALDAFESWVSTEMGAPFDELEPIRTLRAAAHAETGHALRAANALDWPKLDDKPDESEGQKVLNAYGKIKENAQKNDCETATGGTILPPYPSPP